MRLSMIKICLLCLFCSLLLGSLSACREDTRVEHVHELVDVAAVAPTCDTVGKTQGEKCTLCGQMTVIPQSIPATGHVYSDEWTTDIAPTADAPGERSRHCTVCDVRIAITEIPRLAPYTQGLSFALNEDKNGYVCTGVGTASDLSLLHIPASYEGLPVTHIGAQAFMGNPSIRSLIVPESVTFIDKSAFYGCSALKSISLPNTLEYIASQAFHGTACYADAKMWEDGALYIGNHLIAVKPATVNGSYTIHAGTRTVAGMAFYKCNQLTDIELPEGVVSIGNSSFYGCSALSSIRLPSSLETIGAGALAYCHSLKEFTLPSGTRHLLSNPFPGCTALETIKVDPYNPYFHSINNCLIERSSGTLCAAGVAATIPQDGTVKGIGMAAFYQMTALQGELRLPDGLKHIDQSAFYECTGITSVLLPDSLLTVGLEAFKGCSALTELTVPGSVHTIEANAFANCNRLQSVKLPEGLAYIGDGAFAYCFGLQTINLPDSLAYLGDGALLQCKQLVSEVYGNCLYLNNWVIGVENKAVTTVTLKPTTRGIASSAFAGCNELTELELPASVVFIGDQAFLSCWRLTEIRIPQGVTSLESKTFAYCTWLTDIYLPSTLTLIESQVLLNCSALTNIHYAGSSLSFAMIDKASDWNSGAGSYRMVFD